MNVHIFENKREYNAIKVNPGDWVVIKPNLVKEKNLTTNSACEAVMTSPAIIKEVAAYVCQSLEGKGRVTICDAPQTDSSFHEISKFLGLTEIADDLSKRFDILVEVVDLRNEEWTAEDEVIVDRKTLAGDPNGTVAFNLGRDSLFYNHTGEGNYYGADYDSKTVNSHHHGDTHEYLLCKTPILADVYINLPKLKTHKKTGVTLSIKNLVGINADKNWLPHHTDGSPSNGGDQFPDESFKHTTERFLVSIARSIALKLPFIGPHITKKLRKAGKRVFGDGDTTIRSGNWHGNDTTWRMAIDLNRCLLYGNSDGSLRSDNPKRYYSVIDGIVAMEGNGPMHGEPKQCGVVIVSEDPAAADIVSARLMGFDYRKLPVVRELFGLKSRPITTIEPKDINIVSDKEDWNLSFEEFEKLDLFQFKPHFGWKNHIEYELKGTS